MLSRRIHKEAGAKVETLVMFERALLPWLHSTQGTCFSLLYIYSIIYGKRALVIFVRKIESNRFLSSTTCRATLSHKLILHIYINLYIRFI